MARKKDIEITELQGETENSKIFVISQKIKGFNSYERAKAINNFINRETNVLETAIESHLRLVLKKYGSLPMGGTKQALESAFDKLHNLGVDIQFYDRYANVKEKIVGENNGMTVILENDILSAAIEVEVTSYGRT